MEQQGEVHVNCAFAKLMTGQQQVMDFIQIQIHWSDPTLDLTPCMPDFITNWIIGIFGWKLPKIYIDLFLCLICPPKCLICPPKSPISYLDENYQRFTLICSYAWSVPPNAWSVPPNAWSHLNMNDYYEITIYWSGTWMIQVVQFPCTFFLYRMVIR